MNQNEQEIFNTLKEKMIELFEIEEDKLLPTAKLYDELDIDSIDAVDLLIELKSLTGPDLKPEEFTQAETILDVVKIIAQNK